METEHEIERWRKAAAAEARRADAAERRLADLRNRIIKLMGALIGTMEGLSAAKDFLSGGGQSPQE